MPEANHLHSVSHVSFNRVHFVYSAQCLQNCVLFVAIRAHDPLHYKFNLRTNQVQPSFGNLGATLLGSHLPTGGCGSWTGARISTGCLDSGASRQSTGVMLPPVLVLRQLFCTKKWWNENCHGTFKGLEC